MRVVAVIWVGITEPSKTLVLHLVTRLGCKKKRGTVSESNREEVESKKEVL